MGVIVNKNNQQNDELSRRITADLRSKAVQEKEDDIDMVEDARYLKDYEKTGKFGWVWIVLIVLATLSLISMIFV